MTGRVNRPHRTRWGEMPLAERFWTHVHKADGEGCWEWTAYRNKKGYGCTGGRGRGSGLLAHRLSRTMANGPIPPGLYVCHRCHNRACVRPDHLYVGTQKDNMRDREAAGRNYWKNHPDLFPRGDANWNTKVSDATVSEMRLLFSLGAATQGAIGAVFGVNPKTAQNLIVGRRHRKHVGAAEIYDRISSAGGDEVLLLTRATRGTWVTKPRRKRRCAAGSADPSIPGNPSAARTANTRGA